MCIFGDNQNATRSGKSKICERTSKRYLVSLAWVEAICNWSWVGVAFYSCIRRTACWWFANTAQRFCHVSSLSWCERNDFSWQAQYLVHLPLSKCKKWWQGSCFTSSSIFPSLCNNSGAHCLRILWSCFFAPAPFCSLFVLRNFSRQAKYFRHAFCLWMLYDSMSILLFLAGGLAERTPCQFTTYWDLHAGFHNGMSASRVLLAICSWHLVATSCDVTWPWLVASQMIRCDVAVWRCELEGGLQL